MKPASTGARATRALGILVAAGVLAATAACSSPSNSGGGDSGTKDPVVIGAFGSATGSARSFGVYAQEGWKLAEEDVNKRGGIDGRKVQVKFEDDGSEPAQAASIAQQYVSDPATLVLTGPSTSAAAFASQPIAVQAGMPVVVMQNSDPRIMKQGDEIHRIVIPDPSLNKVLTDLVVKDQGYSTIAILHAQDDPFAEASYQAFKEQVAAISGLKLVADVGYSATAPDLGPQIRKVAGSNPDAVIVAAGPSGEAGLVLQQGREQGMTMPIIGNAGFNSPVVLERAGDAAKNVVLATQYWVDDPSKANKAFVKEYTKEFGHEPSPYSATAYNSVFLIKEAAEKVKGELTRASLQKALTGLKGYKAGGDYLGAPLTFVDRDATTDKPFLLMTDPKKPTALIAYDKSTFGK